MASFDATAIGTKCIMNSPLGDIHEGKMCLNTLSSCDHEISKLHYCTVPTVTLDTPLCDYAI